MALKKAGKIVNENINEVIESLTPSSVDSSLGESEIPKDQVIGEAPQVDETSDKDAQLSDVLNEDQDKGPVFIYDDDDTPPTMTSVPQETYEGRGMTPANEITEAPSRRVRRTIKTESIKKEAKPATDIDLENLDESQIMNMPEIKAASFEILSLLDLKPKDKSIRFRWANYKNHVAGNLANYYRLGYQTASIDDVDIERTPVDVSMIDGTQIKYYDILLLKIPVMRLMALYKANIIKSVNRLAKARDRGLREANRDFKDQLSAEPGAISGFNKVKQALGGVDPVQFYVPGAEESQVVGK